MKCYGTGVGTNETVFDINGTVYSTFSHYYLSNFVLNSDPRLRILDNPLRMITSQWLVLLRLPIQWYNMVLYEKVPVPLPEPQNGISP